MPLNDGTGPFGLGPGTGRRRGWCNAGFRFGNIGCGAVRGKNRWLLGLAAPLVVAVIRDLASPTGFLRQFISAFLPGKGMRKPLNIRHDAEYSVIDRQSDKTYLKRNNAMTQSANHEHRHSQR